MARWESWPFQVDWPERMTEGRGLNNFEAEEIRCWKTGLDSQSGA
jgi:hypothetical protein